jgi:cobalt-zinc-cadmium efflux system outer membrane protein
LRAEFGYDLALAYAEAEVAQARIDLLGEDLSRAQENVRSARALVQAGKEGELRAVQADAAASAATAELESARADAIAALAQLSSLVGVAEPYTSVNPSLLVSSRPIVATQPATGQSADIPTIATAEAERELADRRLTVERKRAIPTPSVSVGVRRIAGDDATVWVAGISMPIPIFDRNRGDIAAARADLTAADARLAAARIEAGAQWRAASAQIVAANSRLTASDQGETSAREAYRLARIGYDAGRTPLFELLGTRRALTEAQLRSVDARLARVRAQAALSRLAGRIPFVE